MTKIDIISGFLGAGKTTLIKKLIGEAFQGEKLVLIENEFGEIGIDGGFLKDAGIEITEMNSGCICCSLVGDFGTALQEVIDKYAPDRIIIEPSGVGKLSDVIKAVQGLDNAEIEINSTTAVVDCMKAKMYMKNFGEFFNNQIESAGTVVLSRTQKVPQKVLEDCVKQIRDLNDKASLITTAWDDIDGKTILAAMEKVNALEEELLAAQHVCPTCGHVHEHDHDHEHHHEEGECCHDHHDHEHHHEEGECCHGHHDHEHHHEEGECCHDHHDHEHDHEEGECCHDHHDHEHDHEEGECCHDHHDHEHDHEEGECCHGHHDHEHDHEEGECGCGHHHHHEHECGCGHDHHGHHHADDVFTSWGKETPRKFTKEEVKEVLEMLAHTDNYGTILRAKGMLPAEDGTWIYFDMTPGEYELREGSADYTGRICVIGTRLQEEELSVLFHLV